MRGGVNWGSCQWSGYSRPISRRWARGRRTREQSSWLQCVGMSDADNSGMNASRGRGTPAHDGGRLQAYGPRIALLTIALPMSRAGSTRSSGPDKVLLALRCASLAQSTIAAAVQPVHRRRPRGSSPGWSHQPPRGAGRLPDSSSAAGVPPRAGRSGPSRGRTIAPWPSPVACP